MCGKSVKHMYYVKNDLFGCFKNRGERDDGNETGLKEGGLIEIEIYSAFHLRDARSLFAFVLTHYPHFNFSIFHRGRQSFTFIEGN